MRWTVPLWLLPLLCALPAEPPALPKPPLTPAQARDAFRLATGRRRWRDGVIVTAAPHIVHLRDTEGKGKTDKREILFEGFAALNPQLRVSHPTLGLDGWVYVANGLRGGQVKRAGKEKAV